MSLDFMSENIDEWNYIKLPKRLKQNQKNTS
jgi:hypothetical protein